MKSARAQNNPFGYAAWIFDIYQHHQNVTIRELEQLVEQGVISPFEDIEKSVAKINKDFRLSIELIHEAEAVLSDAG